MAKQLLEDMVVVPNKEKKIPEQKARENFTVEPKYSKKRSRYLLWFIAFFSVAFLIFALSFLFGHAEISVTPKSYDAVLNENLSASKDSTTDLLSFDVVIISGSENSTIKASGEKAVSQSSTGTVIIYNAFSSSPQPLDIDTRLQGSNGKIYKTKTKTVVPGESKSGVPGSVTVSIYGSAPGADYNSTPLDFTILGFKGTPKYAKIYGRSNGEITGGLVGQAPDILPADQAVALASLRNTLQADLIKKAASQIPPGFILFKGATFLEADDLNVSSTYNNEDNTMTLTQKGALYGILFDEQKLAQKIALDNIQNYDGSDIYVPNIQNLIFTLTLPAGLSNQDTASFNTLQNINFNLSGSAKIVWKVDVDKFTADLLGKSKSNFNQTLMQYPNISSATLTLSPFWKMSIPDKAKNVKVVVNYPK